VPDEGLWVVVVVLDEGLDPTTLSLGQSVRLFPAFSWHFDLGERHSDAAEAHLSQNL
jgi:hypothetical protein